MTPFVLLISGSREHPHPEIVGPRIGELALGLGNRPLVVRHGACPGPKSVDNAADQWIKECGEWLGVTADPHPADWDNCAPDCPPNPAHRRWKKTGDIWHPGDLPDYCPGAGPRRNAHVTRLGADRMYAWPAGASYGTRNCMRLARQAGIHVQEITQ